MRLCVMVEGQEGVVWDDWLVLARTTEELDMLRVLAEEVAPRLPSPARPEPR